MSLFSGLKSKIFLAVFLLSGVFLFVFNSKTVQAYHAASSYDKLYNDTLTSENWNDLFDDFVNNWLPVSLNGPVGIATAAPDSGLEVNGIIRGGSFLSSGSVGIGTTSPSVLLQVAPTSGASYSILAAAAGGAYRIGNVDDPSIDSDATNKYYVDSAISSATTSMITMPIGTNGQTLRNNSGTWTADSFLYNNGTNIGIGTTSPEAKLDITTDALGSTVTESSGLSLSNTTAAAAGVQQISPILKWRGQGWASTGGTSQTDEFAAYVLPVQGTTNSSANLIFASSINGGAYTSRLTLTSAGAVTTTGALTIVGALAGGTTGAFSTSVTTPLVINTGATVALFNTATAAQTINIGNGVTTTGVTKTINIGNLGAAGSITNTTIGSSVSTATLNLGTGVTASGKTNTVNIGTNGADGSVTTIAIGSAAGTSVTSLSGSVGIGTTSPSVKLQVAPTGVTYSILAAAAGYAYRIGNVDDPSADYDAANKYYVDSTISSATSSMITMPIGTNGQTLRNNSGTWMADSFLYNNGTNIGIGTTTPGAKLHALSTTEQLRLGYNNINYNSFTVGATGSLDIAAVGTNPNITLTPGGTGYTILNGKVGIGTTGPNGKLDVAGAVYSEGGSFTGTGATPDTVTDAGFVMPYEKYLYGYTTNNVSLRKLIGISSSNVLDIGQSGTALVATINLKAGNAGYIALIPGGGEAVRVISNGSVGIGTTSPSALLQVAPTGVTYSILAAAAGYAYRIGNVDDPSADEDAANKYYVDSTISSATSSMITMPIGTNGQTLRNNSGTWVATSNLFNDGTNIGIGTTSPGTAKLAVIGGNVGIGTTAPGAKLEVGDSTLGDNVPLVYFQGSYAGNSARLQIQNYQVGTDDDRVGFYWEHQNVVNTRMWMGDNGYLYDLGVTPTSANGGRRYIREDGINGNVGIGTTNPNVKLSVEGITRSYNGEADPTGVAGAGASFLLNNTANSYAIGIGAIDGSQYPMWFQTGSNGGGFEWYINISEKMRIDKTGKVGIGTTSPSVLLQVAPASGTYSILAAAAANVYRIGNVDEPSADEDAANKYYVDSTISSATTSMITMPIGTNGQTLRNNSGTWAATSNLFNDGTKVGIGTTDPGAKLDVHGDVIIKSVTNSVPAFSIEGIGTSNHALWAYTTNDWTGNMDFQKVNVGVTIHLTADGNSYFNNGNVGIGTTAPGSKLTNQTGNIGNADGLTAGAPAFQWQVGAQGYAGVFSNTGGGGQFADGLLVKTIGTSNTVDAIIDLESGGVNRVRVTGAGNVGIGTTTPSALLQVAPASGTYSILAAAAANVYRIGNVDDPSANEDAANKYYVDSAISTATSSMITMPIGTNGQTLRNNSGAWVATSNLFNDGTSIGIGTTAPGVKLHVGPTALYTTNIVDPNSANVLVAGGSVARLFVQSTGESSIGLIDTGAGANGKIMFLTTDGGITKFRSVNDVGDAVQVNNILVMNHTSGNVGVGYADPGTAKLAINGNVGIGTTIVNASNKLDVVGGGVYIAASDGHADASLHITTSYGGFDRLTQIAPTGASKPGLNLMGFTDAASADHWWVWGPTSADIWRIQSGTGFSGSAGLSIDNAGKVGIGITNPSVLLQVAPASGTYSILAGGTAPTAYRIGNVDDPSANEDAANKYYVDSAISTATSSMITMPIGTNGQTLRNNSGTWAATSNLFNDGTSVGIGTTNPGEKLQVAGGMLWLTGLTSNVANINGLGFWGGDNGGGIYARGTTGAGSLDIFNTAGRIYLATTGNVGIGTTGPNKKLHVTDDVWTDTSFQVLDRGADYYMIQAGSGATEYPIGLRFQGSPDTLSLDNGYGDIQLIPGISGTLNGSSAIVTVKQTTGNVGIGTTGPSVKLHVAPTSGTYSILAGGTAPTAYRIGNVDDPSAVDDAVTKYYVDNLFAGFGSYLPLAGGTMTGAINMGNNNISNVNTLTVTKLTATTIDPLYTINGINYSTFAPSIAGGVKEECIGKIKISKLNAVKEYEAVIDFSAATEGSDLWVWRQVIDFNKDSVDVVITPYGEFARVYYVISDNKLIFRSDKAVEISYRLIAKRYDWRDWPTQSEDQTTPGVVR